MKFRVIYLLALFVAPWLQAQERYTLERFIEEAEKTGAQLAESQGKVEAAEARLDFARAKALPSAEFESLLSFVPDAEGDAVSGRNDWSRIGPFSQSKVTVIQPLYAWGALGAGRQAARAGLEAERKLLEKEKWALRTQVTEIYYGYQLAFELSEIAEDVEKKLQTALARLEKSSKRKAADVAKLKSSLSELRIKKGEAEKGLAQARLGMAWKTGRYGKEIPKWDRANLVERTIALKDLAEYQRLATEHRPELQALAKEMEARKSLVVVEQGQMLPLLFLAGRVEYSVAPERPDQRSPFAYDPANAFSAGAGVGLKWNLGIFERNSKIAQARADLRQAEGKSRYLGDGIRAEVEKNYLDVKWSQNTLQLRKELSQDLKRQYNDALAQLGLGTGDPKVLFEQMGAFMLAEKSRLETIYQLNTQVAKFEQALGTTL